MPLHNWDEVGGWEGVHHFWITHLCHALKSQLPPEYRAYVGSVPTLSVTTPERPDVAVRHWLPDPPSGDAAVAPAANAVLEEPLVEVATLAIDPQVALYVTHHGRLVAAIELISPRNKDRPSARAAYLARYLGYLQEGANLLLVDVHPRPRNFSFAEALERELQLSLPPLPTPLAATFRVGEPAPTGGRLVAVWHKQLKVGSPLPVMPLPLTVHSSVAVDLEASYELAAADAYLT